ncbi:MAG: hypothetical protein MN733_30025 [Nitrososphaera sp.]|nr:hypothetical protein [Nitrososphaera sp.]
MQMLANYADTTATASPICAVSIGALLEKQDEPHMGRKAVVRLSSTLWLLNIQPGTPSIEADTARSFISPFGKDQILNRERSDLKLIARIRELGTYADGWDGAEGRSPSRSAVNDAEHFARSFLQKEELKKPIISLAADGEIAFLWALPSVRLDLGFYGDGTYSYYGRSSSGEEFMSDDGESIHTPLPEKLMELIGRSKS